MPKTVSFITNAQITAKISGDGYVAADYVADDYFEGGVSQPVFSNIINKYADHVVFGLYGLDGNPVDATFDAVFQTLPEQYANGANLSAR